MVVCGDDALAHRLAAELRDVYGERVTLVVPSARERHRPRIPPPARALERAGALLGRVSAAMTRTTPLPPEEAADGAEPPEETVRVLEAAQPDDAALAEAGIVEAGALALVYDDDELNIHAALRARRLNPRLRLVIRLYNRKLGQHLEELLDQAAAVAALGTEDAGDAEADDASTTVLSDADTVAPALAATAVAGTSKVIEADGLLLRAVERAPVPPGRPGGPGLCTLALLSASANDPAEAPSSARGDEGPCCCRTTPRPRKPSAAAPSSWRPSPIRGGRCAPADCAAGARRSPRSSPGGCAGPWPGSSARWWRSPSPGP